eukprot:NODE_302_length_10333_cov_0.506840.p9 type:complete len:121 gc:universal NODE_302_length_10333_cov_0.506840:1506-1868(+)
MVAFADLGKNRPSNMKNATIKRRRRLPVIPMGPRVETPQLNGFDQAIVSQHVSMFGNSLVLNSQTINPSSLRDMLNNVSSFQAFLYDALLKLEAQDPSQSQVKPNIQPRTQLMTPIDMDN